MPLLNRNLIFCGLGFKTGFPVFKSSPVEIVFCENVVGFSIRFKQPFKSANQKIRLCCVFWARPKFLFFGKSGFSVKNHCFKIYFRYLSRNRKFSIQGSAFKNQFSLEFKYSMISKISF
jgi:hypothetical protein